MAYYVAEPCVPKRSVCPAVAGQRAVCQPADGCSRWPLPVAAPGGRACFSARFGRRLLPSCIPRPRPGGRMFVNFGSLNGPHCHHETSLWQRSPFRNRVCLMLVWSPKLSREGRGHGAPLPPVRLRPEQWQAERASRGWHGAGSRVFVP